LRLDAFFFLLCTIGAVEWLVSSQKVSRLTYYCSPNIATAIGPILGGALAQSHGWRWIFWLLSFLSGACLVLIAVFLPETARSVVGNGSVKAIGCHRTLFSYFQFWQSTSPGEPLGSPETGQTSPTETSIRNRFHVLDSVESLKLLGAKDCLLIVLIFGVFYTNLSCVQASTSTLFIKVYGISELQAGLIYLPSGVGSILGAYGVGNFRSFYPISTSESPFNPCVSFGS
jgi:predicted MFS family arabinose efflux permease